MKNKLDVLVVIDMQNDFLTGSLANYKAYGVKEGVIKLIHSMYSKSNSDKKLYLFATRDTHHENYLETLEGKKLPVVHCIEGTEGWEIDKDIKDIIEDYYYSDSFVRTYINKPTFGSSELVNLIKGLYQSYDLTITLCGVCTDICVVSNALMLRAALPDTPIKVVRDATAGVTIESEEAAIKTMKSCQIDIV